MAGLAVAPSPASATALNGVAVSSIDFDAGTGCTLSVPAPDDKVGPVQSDGLGSDLTISSSTVATKTGMPTDTTTMSASMHATASSTEADGGIRTLDVSGSGSVTNSAALGNGATGCDSSNDVSVTTQGFLDVDAPLLLDVRSSVRGGPGAVATVFVTSLGGLFPVTVIDQSSSQDGTSRRLVRLPAGGYSINVVVGMSQDTQSVDASTKSFGSSVHVDFRSPGEASSAARGAGTKYVTLPSALDCSAHSATVSYTKAAKAAKKGTKGHKGKKATLSKATFYVDGVQARTAKKPDKDTETVLTGIAATSAVTIEAVVQVHGKGTVDLRRTYSPCS
jgi:hypothetical protein